MIFNNLLVAVGVALQAGAVQPIMFILGRFVLGINAGMFVNHINNISFKNM